MCLRQVKARENGNRREERSGEERRGADLDATEACDWLHMDYGVGVAMHLGQTANIAKPPSFMLEA